MKIAYKFEVKRGKENHSRRLSRSSIVGATITIIVELHLGCVRPQNICLVLIVRFGGVHERSEIGALKI